MGLLLAIPFLLLLLLFALSNRQMVQIALWPTDWSVDLMLSVAMLGIAAAAFLFGGLTVWLSELGRRRRLRGAERKIVLLEEQLRTLKSRAALPGTGRPPMKPLA